MTDWASASTSCATSTPAAPDCGDARSATALQGAAVSQYLAGRRGFRHEGCRARGEGFSPATRATKVDVQEARPGAIAAAEETDRPRRRLEGRALHVLRGRGPADSAVSRAIPSSAAAVPRRAWCGRRASADSLWRAGCRRRFRTQAPSAPVRRVRVPWGSPWMWGNSGQGADRGVVQDDSDERRLECCRALDGQPRVRGSGAARWGAVETVARRWHPCCGQGC